MTLTRRSFFAGLAACPLCAAAARAEGPHWTYEEAPKWGDEDPAFKACGIGSEQSPIDLTGAFKAEIHAPKVSWKPEAFKVLNNGHTVQANASPGASAVWEGRTFDLKQFHFHTPSEHALDGKRTAMEVHFVHAEAGGELLVLGAFLKAGAAKAANGAFSAVMAAAPKAAGDAALKAAIDPAAMLPKGRHFYQYEGSLTTPPCSEIVNWVVFAEPVEVAQADIDAFKAIFPMNARPLQPQHRRVLLQD